MPPARRARTGIGPPLDGRGNNRLRPAGHFPGSGEERKALGALECPARGGDHHTVHRRFDPRDGQYELVDFNARMGNQFRLFQTTAGIDVVRALHLDMSGRCLPAGEQASGRMIIVEHLHLPVRPAYRKSLYSAPHAPRHPTSTELAWAARDDPVPFFAVWPRLAMPLAPRLGRVLTTGGRRRLSGLSAVLRSAVSRRS